MVCCTSPTSPGAASRTPPNTSTSAMRSKSSFSSSTPASERVSLGYKQKCADPWSDVSDRYPLGSRVKGRVVSLTDYGAFIELEEGVEGLIHVSEMSWTKKIRHPSKMLEHRRRSRSGRLRRQRSEPPHLAVAQSTRAEPVGHHRRTLSGRHGDRQAKSATSPTSVRSSKSRKASTD